MAKSMLKRKLRGFASPDNLRQALATLLAVVGVLWLVLEFGTWAWPSAVPDKPTALLGSLAISLLIAIRSNWPRLSHQRKFDRTSTTVEIRVDDLLAPGSASNIAIMSSEYFDSCVETAISPRSLKGQLISRYFGSKKTDFDRQVDASLSDQRVEGKPVQGRAVGTNRLTSYAPGTVAAVPLGQRTAFVVVAAKMDPATTKTMTSPEALWASLDALWHAAATKGHRQPLAMPLWGANLGNAPGNRLILLQTILSSFAVHCAASHQPCTSHLSIVIWEGDYDADEFRRMCEAVDNTCL